jgi:hypothetical protein
VQQYLFFYLGFYVYQMAVLLKEPRLKDFWVMAVHHIVTMTLVSFAYAAGYARICRTDPHLRGPLKRGWACPCARHAGTTVSHCRSSSCTTCRTP